MSPVDHPSSTLRPTLLAVDDLMSQKFDATSMMAWCGRVVLIYSPEVGVKTADR